MLVVDHLTKTFGGLMAVNDLSFKVEKGEIVGLIGPNGSGKTVSFETISGFYAPTKGDIFFKGERISGLPPYKILKRGLARSFQVLEIMPEFTVLDTVVLAGLHAMPLSQARKHAMEVLAFIGLTAKADWHVSEITPADQRALEVAKVVATGADMILLDEVMAGLTEPEARHVMGRIRELRQNRGITFLVVEHHMEVIMDLCDRIVVLNFGTKIAEGTPKEIANHQQVIDAYLGQELTVA